MSNAGFREPRTEGDKIVSRGDREKNEVGLWAADEVATSGDRGMTGLDGLMIEGHILANNNVNVFDLQHAWQDSKKQSQQSFLVVVILNLSDRLSTKIQLPTFAAGKRWCSFKLHHRRIHWPPAGAAFPARAGFFLAPSTMPDIQAFLRAWTQQAIEKIDAAGFENAPQWLSDYAVNERWGVEITIHRAPPSVANAASQPASLTALDREILKHLKASGQTMNRIANLSNHDNDSYFRSRVRRLVKLGLARREGQAYALPLP